MQHNSSPSTDDLGLSDSEPEAHDDTQPLDLPGGADTSSDATDGAGSSLDREGIVVAAATAISLFAVLFIMTSMVHLSVRPSIDLIFDDNTPTGGDFGAHVWGPAFLRDYLLSSFRLNGWSMDWYAGFPAYRFYMVLPALGVLLADLVLPYGVALKLVAVTGIVSLPVSCFVFGKLARFRYPVPQLFAFGGLAFALDESYKIYGGNLKSTMAGEFSFSIALSLAMLALGVLALGLETGRYRVWSALLLSAACVSHGIVLIFTAVAAVVFCLVWMDRKRWMYAVTVGTTTVLLMLWWLGPFLAGHEYMTDMKYGPRPGGVLETGEPDSYWAMLFPLAAPLDILISTLAVIGFGFAILRRNRHGVALGLVCLIAVFGVFAARDSLPIIGLLWNPRVLPFVYITRYLLMMLGVAELGTMIANLVRDRRALHPGGVVSGTATWVVGSLGVLVVLGFLFQSLPFGGMQPPRGKPDQAAVYTWGPFQASASHARGEGDGWAKYNFAGYEGRGAQYTEYYNIVQTMKTIGEDPDYGCGRANWENADDNKHYGTSMALMLLPHWTDGCIGSMEGLFFEASGTTPYHFLTTAAMSKQSSNPVRELRYVNNNAPVGVPHMQALGVRYAMVRTDEAKAQAAIHPELTLIASSGPWEVYLVADSDVVEGLDVQPVVVNRRPGDQRERYLEVGTSWLQQPGEWAAPPAADGIAGWQRIDVTVDPERRKLRADGSREYVDIVVPEQSIDVIELPEITVSDLVVNQQSLRFSVDQIGVPVVVKVSYFPNWRATGAEGPFRFGPNMMVVVPTASEVSLEYGRSMVDYLSVLGTLLGLGLCVVWRRQGDLDFSVGDNEPQPVGPGDDSDDTPVQQTLPDLAAIEADKP